MMRTRARAPSEVTTRFVLPTVLLFVLGFAAFFTSLGAVFGAVGGSGATAATPSGSTRSPASW